jgi:hypothetical protein
MSNAITSNEREHSPAAARMRRYRQRRSNGMRCMMVELRETEVDALVRSHLLAPESRMDRAAVLRALYRFLDTKLGGLP